jgi:hypothetical protein
MIRLYRGIGVHFHPGTLRVHPGMLFRNHPGAAFTLARNPHGTSPLSSHSVLARCGLFPKNLPTARWPPLAIAFGKFGRGGTDDELGKLLIVIQRV